MAMQSKRTWCSDQGDGTYLNPLMHGEYPDPAILKDGEDYYMVNCCQPMMWHSRDLMHWEPLYMMEYSIGGAADLSKVGDTYYLYNINPFVRDEDDYQPVDIVALTTKDIRNPHWDGPFIVGPAFNMPNGGELIDPGLLVDYEGKKWLYMSDNYCFPLTDDGLSLAGPGKRVLEDEVFPDDWEIQGVYTEGPRFCKKNGYIYLIVAAGGTMGPPTSHGVFAYRSKNPQGPWERSPYNPIIRTFSKDERWLSKGHGTLVEAPDGQWYMIYHGFMNGRYNHARMPLMEPVEWTDDGWFRIAEGSDPAKPLPAPKGGTAVEHGYPLSIQFPEENPLPGEWLMIGNMAERVSNCPEGWRVKGAGTTIFDCGGAIQYQGLFRNFEITIHATALGGAGVAIGMYYSRIHSLGYGLKDNLVSTFIPPARPLHRIHAKPYNWNKIYLRLVVKEQVVSCFFGPDGEHWEKAFNSVDIDHISQLANIPDKESMGMIMLPALYAYGNGDVIFHSFEMKQLPDDED